jgi:hypothetical protein
MPDVSEFEARLGTSLRELVADEEPSSRWGPTVEARVRRLSVRPHRRNWVPLVAAAVLVAALPIVVVAFQRSGDQRVTAGPASSAPSLGVPSTRPPRDVRVMAANASQTAGLAARTLAFLSEQGYASVDPVDTLQTLGTSSIHFGPGFEAEAQAVARLLRFPGSSVDASAAPVADTRGADIVVVLGQDYATRAAESPTTLLRPGPSPTTTAPGTDTPVGRLQASPLRPDGFGPAFIGMPLENARRFFSDGVSTSHPPPCPHLVYPDAGGVALITASTGDRIDLVTLTGGKWFTDAGVGIGSSVADLTRAYGNLELHGRISSVNGVPASDGQLLFYLPAAQPAYAISFEVERGVVVAMRGGSRERVVAGGQC